MFPLITASELKHCGTPGISFGLMNKSKGLDNLTRNEKPKLHIQILQLADRLPPKAKKVKSLLKNIGMDVKDLEQPCLEGISLETHSIDNLQSVIEQIMANVQQELSRIQSERRNSAASVEITVPELERMLSSIATQEVLLLHLRARLESLQELFTRQQALVLESSQMSPRTSKERNELEDKITHGFVDTDSWSEPSFISAPSEAGVDVTAGSSHNEDPFVCLRSDTHDTPNESITPASTDIGKAQLIDKLALKSLATKVYYLSRELEVCQMKPDTADKSTSTETNPERIVVSNHPSVLREKASPKHKGLGGQIEELTDLLARADLRQRRQETEILGLQEALAVEQQKNFFLEEELLKAFPLDSLASKEFSVSEVENAPIPQRL